MQQVILYNLKLVLASVHSKSADLQCILRLLLAVDYGTSYMLDYRIPDCQVSATAKGVVANQKRKDSKARCRVKTAVRRMPKVTTLANS